MAVSRIRQNGFTLMEAVLSLVIVSIMLVTALNTMGASARMQRVGLSRDQSLPLAHGLMNEIIQSHFEDVEADAPAFGPEIDETLTRADFDDVDDYHNWSASPPETRDGVAMSDYADYTRSVRVEFVDPDDVNGVGSADPIADRGLKRITVEVRRTGQSPVTVQALRARFSSWDCTPTVESTFVRWVGVTLRVGDGAPVDTGVGVLNQLAVGAAP